MTGVNNNLNVININLSHPLTHCLCANFHQISSTLLVLYYLFFGPVFKLIIPINNAAIVYLHSPLT